jgi:hypothetical protein
MTQDTHRPRRGDGADAKSLDQAPTRYTDNEAERALGEIRHWERTSRLIANDSEFTLKHKCVALLQMMARARKSELGSFLELAIWRGAGHLFEPEPPTVPADMIGAIRRLRNMGHDACPECRRHLPSHDDLDHWRSYQYDMRSPA